MTEGGWDVFVSYGHEDAGWVRVLAGNLHRAGFDVFLDEWELVGGDRFAGRLEEAIRGSVNGVLVVSPHALSRPWLREEYEALLRQAVEQPGRRARARSTRRGWVSWCGTCRVVRPRTGPPGTAAWSGRPVRAVRWCGRPG